MKTGLSVLMVSEMALSVSASSDRPVPVGDRARGAEKVVVGRVTDVTTRFGTNKWGDQLIFSDATVQVDETLKGSPVPSLLLTVEGGSIGELTLDVSDMPKLQKGERAVMFLDATPGRPEFEPHLRGHGIMKIDSSDRVVGSGASLEDVRRQIRAAR